MRRRESLPLNYKLVKLAASVMLLLSPAFCWAQTKGPGATGDIHEAPAPLYRDPIYDGPADPVIVWNRQEKSWWMLYTQRRANTDAADVAFCYGTKIGIVSSGNHGQRWVYRGTLDLEFEHGQNTFWAPDVIYEDGTYHMFVAYIRGVYNHWGGQAHIAHYISKNLWDWSFEGMVDLLSDSVIDPTLYHMPDGSWRLWYKDQNRGSVTMLAESKDLNHWIVHDKPAIGGRPHEGPNIFYFKGWYWMLTDEWAGMRVYRSRDANSWERQGRILAGPGSRAGDTPSGAHGDVVVLNGKAYIFYFTHPGRSKHTEAGELDRKGEYRYSKRRSLIQVAMLDMQDGTIVCKRNHFDFWMPALNK